MGDWRHEPPSGHLRQRRHARGRRSGRASGAPPSTSSPSTGRSASSRRGVEGDQVSDTKHHGGIDQAVYAFAREDLDWWAAELGGEIRNGQFAENLTTAGIDVNEAEVGERWRVGTALLEVAMVRIPCNDFKNWQRLNGFDDRGWVSRFAAAVATRGPT